MSLWRTGIMLDGPDGLAVSVSGMRGGRVTSIEPIEVVGHSPEEVADLLRVMVRERSFGRGQIRVVLPVEICENHVRQHAAPLPDEAVTSDAIRYLEEECGMEPHTYDVHTNIYLDDEGRQSVVISVLERGTLSRFRNAFESAGLYDVVLISPVDAMVQMHQTFETSVAAPLRAMIHVGRTQTLMLVVEGDLPVFFRSVGRNLDTQGADFGGYGEGELLPELAPTDQAVDGLAGELVRTVQYFSQTSGSQNEIGQIILTSTNLDLRLLASVLQQHTEVACLPATSTDVTRGVADEDMNGAFAELGMSLPAAVAAPRKLPPQTRMVSTPSRNAEMLTSRRTVGAIMVLYVLCLAAYWAMMVVQTRDLAADVAMLENEEQQLSQTLARRQQQHASRQMYVNNALWLMRMKQQGVLAADMLVAVNNLRPEEVMFGDVHLDAGAALYTMTIKGHVPKLSTHEALRKLDAFAASLRGTELFTNTTINRTLLNGPGGPELNVQEQRQLEQEGVEPNVVNYTLVVQSPTPWSEGVERQ